MSVAIMRAYCPLGTDTQAIRHMMLGMGGYTTYPGRGHWVDSAGNEVAEDVTIFECVTPDRRIECDWSAGLEHAGRVFLYDNPNEQAFLGVIIGASVKSIYITKE